VRGAVSGAGDRENGLGEGGLSCSAPRHVEGCLEECREKNYAAPYAADSRPVWYIAINYNAATRTLDDPLAEQVK